MRILHLLRHAKSAWDQPGLSDRQRGLSKRGRNAAPRMGMALAERLEPMPVHVSPARRAHLTLKGLCAGWPALAAIEHVTDESLYTFDAAELVDWLAAYAGNEESVFIIGHNPALTDLINWLAPAAALDNLPTAAYARLRLEIADWDEIAQGCGELLSLLKPKALG